MLDEEVALSSRLEGVTFATFSSSPASFPSPLLPPLTTKVVRLTIGGLGGLGRERRRPRPHHQHQTEATPSHQQHLSNTLDVGKDCMVKAKFTIPFTKY